MRFVRSRLPVSRVPNRLVTGFVGTAKLDQCDADGMLRNVAEGWINSPFPDTVAGHSHTETAAGVHQTVTSNPRFGICSRNNQPVFCYIPEEHGVFSDVCVDE